MCSADARSFRNPLAARRLWCEAHPPGPKKAHGWRGPPPEFQSVGEHGSAAR